MMEHLMSWIVFIPLLGTLTLLFLPLHGRMAQAVSAAFSLAALALSAYALVLFEASGQSVQLAENFDWIKTFNIAYSVGIDGFSGVLIVATALIFFLAIVFPSVPADTSRGFHALFLALETFVLGTFAAQDFFLFTTFWILTIIPAYFLVSLWGSDDREHAAAKFFTCQTVGALLILVVMFAVVANAPTNTFSFSALTGGGAATKTFPIAGHEFRFDLLFFSLFLCAIALRSPIVPFHNWLAHFLTQAPAPVAAVIAAVFIKTGAYALLRVGYGIFPVAAAESAKIIGILGISTFLYGAIAALAQNDLRRLTAYATISQSGLLVLGLSVFAKSSFEGSVLLVVSHAVASAMLFFLVGALGARTGHFEIVDRHGKIGFGGVAFKAPALTMFFTIALLSTIGVPGFAGFSPEMLVFMGVFSSSRLLILLSLVGVVITAAYLMWMYRRVFLGREGSGLSSFVDLSMREKAILLPLVVVGFWIGFAPASMIHITGPTVDRALSTLEGHK